jgi:hypothetical protein
MNRFGQVGHQAQSSNIHSGADNREPLYRQGRIALPAVGAAQVPILQIPIRRGANAQIWRLAIDYVGPGFIEGSGAILFNLFRDPALSKGVKGFTQLTASMGAVNNPLEIPTIEMREAEVLSICVQNVSLVVGGAQILAAAVGWVFPKEYGTRQRWP